MAYPNYTADGSYWTVRKQGSIYWVARMRRVNGSYEWLDTWGGYERAGAAAGAAAQLAYNQAREDVLKELVGTLHTALDGAGLGALPTPAPVRPPDRSQLPAAVELDEPED
ncbi:hypothetical protein [Micromonospora noduli]|uniref:Uncharacterized protein n=1 Tax=Micromonospora noduli TaxID=709876 RepID=A0A328MU52_9ACTN|nr:hypothetical protein [Micromonospora noduli]RAN94261.1 hypothetical protein LAH08_06096 [Micromonospora noduli]